MDFYTQIFDLYNKLNLVTMLMDEGYINREGKISEGVSYKDINQFIKDEYSSNLEFENNEGIDKYLQNLIWLAKDFGERNSTAANN